jgi:hypothetical protein
VLQQQHLHSLARHLHGIDHQAQHVSSCESLLTKAAATGGGQDCCSRLLLYLQSWHGCQKDQPGKRWIPSPAQELTLSPARYGSSCSRVQRGCAPNSAAKRDAGALGSWLAGKWRTRASDMPALKQRPPAV